MAQDATSKHFLTSIFASLQTIKPSELPAAATPHVSPLKHLPEASEQEAKNILLTLHFLFPHELLPALDLIDRRLITHLYIVSSSSTLPPGDESSELLEKPATENEVYYVQSASSSSSGTSNIGDTGFNAAKRGRFRNALSRPGVFYEVRLDGWNCSCPAFAYSAMRMAMQDVPVIVQRSDRIHDTAMSVAGQKLGWLVGGSATKDDAVMPVCKHILAVALSRAAPDLFGLGVVGREVSKEEMAGWAAGWGEH